jgi:hypothetical protein
LPKKTFEEAARAGVHLIAQVKDNQPTLHQAVADLCATTKPREKTCTVDKNKRLRHKTHGRRQKPRFVDLPGAKCLARA